MFEETEASAIILVRSIVRTPDTGIFVIRHFHMHAINLSIHLDTGSAKLRRLISVSDDAESLGEENCAQLFLVSTCFVDMTVPCMQCIQ